MGKEMTFWDHLDELRGVLFRSAISVFVFLIIIFPNKNFVFDKIIFAPIDNNFILYKWFASLSGLLGISAMKPAEFSIDLINIELSAQFFTHVSVSLTLAFILSTPFILYQFWNFLKPGLYDNEKKSVKKAFGFASILFFAGVLVGYVFVFPLTLRFLGTYQVSEWVANQISLHSYISMFTWLILIMGVVFEMPALAAILSRMGIISKSMLKKYRKHAFAILIFVAAIITPSGDAFTLFIVGTPLYLLYEFSIMICRDFD
ncbi:MAG: twin-arginine translocase subunit TatC [Bacteroidales bacterium]|jgi:sec-independent protein translocase protein TatC|nr:twin-arginine translocase subunit TatC [Bacteroidales bacterium]MDD3300501.1 twin-arginine translocase subunit TatC [Bacteroidales bacterium]MDD3844086.1 twin-arginine translocase subunit TatC [Bacteroidales bacterium]MDD4618207.1 twin-arginine translocase subunit TatC [Bacteroidales bacterium]